MSDVFSIEKHNFLKMCPKKTQKDRSQHESTKACVFSKHLVIRILRRKNDEKTQKHRFLGNLYL